MPRMLLSALVALASLSLFTSAARAQVPAAFTNGYLEWQLRPDAVRVPYDGAPFSDRYSFSFAYNATPLMIGANPNQLWNLYHADKIDRAKRFGYELPASYNPEPLPTVRRGGLLGFGWFRAH